MSTTDPAFLAFLDVTIDIVFSVGGTMWDFGFDDGKETMLTLVAETYGIDYVKLATAVNWRIDQLAQQDNSTIETAE